MPAVLIVDDHFPIAYAVQVMARSAGREAAVVHSGEAALEYLSAHPVSLVILDVSMPGLSGLDVLRELGVSGRLPGLPVVMFSASGEHRDESLRLGAVAFVLKDEADALPALIERYAPAQKRATR